jgi:TRAP-type C4-dicarboxylate transport system permease small subunit
MTSSDSPVPEAPKRVYTPVAIGLVALTAILFLVAVGLYILENYERRIAGDAEYAVGAGVWYAIGIAFLAAALGAILVQGLRGERTFLDHLILGIAHVTKFLIMFIVIIIFYEVVSRYAFGAPTLWVNEMSLWVGSAVYLFAGLYTMQLRAHIRITALYDLVSRPVQRVFDVIAVLVLLGFAGTLVYGAWTRANDPLWRWEKFGTAWNPPIPATIKPLLIIVFALIAIQAINNLVIDWRKPKQIHIPTPDDI